MSVALLAIPVAPVLRCCGTAVRHRLVIVPGQGWCAGRLRNDWYVGSDPRWTVLGPRRVATSLVPCGDGGRRLAFRRSVALAGLQTGWSTAPGRPVERWPVQPQLCGTWAIPQCFPVSPRPCRRNRASQGELACRAGGVATPLARGYLGNRAEADVNFPFACRGQRGRWRCCFLRV